MNSTSTCGYSSLNDVLAQADSGNLNITQLVHDCQAICHLIWGTGNPDLSGIGVHISYIIHAVLVVIFGPIFVTIYGFRHQWDLPPKGVNKLERLHDTFLDASAQFSIPVAVAAVVRIKQNASLYEISFLQSLTTMQFLGLLSTIIASGVVNPRKDSGRILLLTLYGLITFGLYMGFIAHLRTSKQSWTSIKELGSVCQGYSQILPGYAYAHAQIEPSQSKNFGWIITGLVLAGVVGLILALAIIILLGRALKSKQAHILCPISLGLTIGSLYCLAQMETKRSIMKSITGDEFQDDQWAFGQVISLFLWAPILIQTIYFLTAKLFEILTSMVSSYWKEVWGSKGDS